MVLALTHGGQVAQALIGGLVEQFQASQRLLPFPGQLAFFARLAQRTQHALIVILANQPAGTVPAIVRHVERYVALGGWRVVEIGQLTVIVQIV